MYINRLHRNKIKFVQYTYFYWYLLGKRRYKRIFYVSIDSVFYGEYENDPQGGFEPWIFEQVPAHDLNFEGD